MDLRESAAWRSQSDKAEVYRLSQLHYAREMERLRSIMGNLRLSRRRRIAARQEAKDLHFAHFGARIDTDSDEDSTKKDVEAATDSDNSSVSSVSSVPPLTKSQREWLWDWNMLDGDPDADRKFDRILESERREKLQLKLQQKKQQKRNLRAKVVAERAARAAERERQNRAKLFAERREQKLSAAEQSSAEFLRKIFGGVFDSVADDES
jgi:hypothetical protein